MDLAFPKRGVGGSAGLYLAQKGFGSAEAIGNTMDDPIIEFPPGFTTFGL
jgi:hypothetical protein